MTIFLIDSGLSNLGGHHDHFVRGWCENPRVGATTIVLGPKEASAEVRRQVSLLPVLSRSLYDCAAHSGDPFEDYCCGSGALADDLEASGIQPGEEDVIFLPTATPRELAGVCRWFSKQGGPRPAIAAIFHWGTDEALRAETPQASQFRWAARLIKQTQLRRCWLGGTHESLRHGLQDIFRQPVQLVPSMTFFPREGRELSPPIVDRLPLLAFLGGARTAKGAGTIPGFLRRALQQELPARFAIQCHGTLPSAGLNGLRSDSVLLLEDWLPTRQFNALLASAAAVVLPYDRRAYGAMVSGTFTISAAFGKPCIVPSETWMSERIIEGEATGVVYEGDGPEALFDAVNTFLRDADRLSEAALRFAHSWRRAYSADRLVEAIADWANPFGANGPGSARVSYPLIPVIE